MCECLDYDDGSLHLCLVCADMHRESKQKISDLELEAVDLQRTVDTWQEIASERVSGWGFELLMIAADHILERYYPADIMDGSNTFFPSTDPGVKLVQALRECRKVTDKNE